MKGLKVFIVDDEPLMRLSMRDALEGLGCEVTAAATGTEGLAILSTRQFDIVITDLRLPGADGLAILKESKERCPTTEVILITAHGSVDTAVGAITLGAYDYITKPFQMDELLLIVERVGKIIALRRESLESKGGQEDQFSFGGIHSGNQHVQALLENVKLQAATNSPISIFGEPGTGKELVAHAIHLNSARRDQALVKVCCANLPENLMELELFGHEKGAIPGAIRQRRGRLEMAQRGTLYLDDIDALSLALQARLLRFLKEKRLLRVGGGDAIDIDVRLICSSRCSLAEGVMEGRFLKDLFEWFRPVTIRMPPLRERREDVLMIADKCARMDEATAAFKQCGRMDFDIDRMTVRRDKNSFYGAAPLGDQAFQIGQHFQFAPFRH